jgi:EAL and modified HD-GYP domain-containing signal transduction protein
VAVASPTLSSFVARQPIVDRERQLFGYELLCRPSLDATSCIAPYEQASARVLVTAVTDIGLQVLTEGKPAFVNVTRALLLDGAPMALPPSSIVVELLETIDADPEVLTACARLRDEGFQIALDDFALTDANAALIPFADYIKVDVLASNADERRRVLDHVGPRDVKLLAEKVESQEVFEQVVREGFDYFQGYFFGRPVTQQARTISGHQVGVLQLMQAVQNPDLGIDALETRIKQNSTMAYRVLRAVNGAGVGLRKEVRSIREALVLLGRQTIRRWVTVLALADLGGSGSTTLVTWSAVRARFCELIGERSNRPLLQPRGFLLGMCSLLDGVLDCPMPVVLEALPLDTATKAALLGAPSDLGVLLECVVAYERGEWSRCYELAAEIGVEPTVLPGLYAEALRWAHS